MERMEGEQHMCEIRLQAVSAEGKQLVAGNYFIHNTPVHVLGDSHLSLCGNNSMCKYFWVCVCLHSRTHVHVCLCVCARAGAHVCMHV